MTPGPKTTAKKDRAARAPGDGAAAAAMLKRLRRGADMRRPVVARLKSAISRQTYVNLLKLDVAADRLIERLDASDLKEFRR